MAGAHGKIKFGKTCPVGSGQHACPDDGIRADYDRDHLCHVYIPVSAADEVEYAKLIGKLGSENCQSAECPGPKWQNEQHCRPLQGIGIYL